MTKIGYLLILFCGTAFGQIPEWYQHEMARSVGTWMADNASYMNEQETDEAYGISWEWGAGQKSLIGRLYGLKDSKVTNQYWQFFQFWDNEAQKARVIQVSPWGVKGEGFLEKIDSVHTKMSQTFIMPNGSSYESGHTTEIHKNKEISVSFEIKEGEWIENRTYIWYKQNE